MLAVHRIRDQGAGGRGHEGNGPQEVGDRGRPLPATGPTKGEYYNFILVPFLRVLLREPPTPRIIVPCPVEAQLEFLGQIPGGEAVGLPVAAVEKGLGIGERAIVPEDVRVVENDLLALLFGEGRVDGGPGGVAGPLPARLGEGGEEVLSAEEENPKSLRCRRLTTCPLGPIFASGGSPPAAWTLETGHAELTRSRLLQEC
jgi:hypothetical protein